MSQKVYRNDLKSQIVKMHQKGEAESQKVYRNDLKSQIVKMHQKGEARSVITKLFDQLYHLSSNDILKEVQQLDQYVQDAHRRALPEEKIF
ncbi:hypothetical protein QE152_g26764 [Popillia japonica]|uniref:Uncharacterized protein n=1 Tax=Popillia japonica TaxID=7064 RepID=A0AAW1JXH8_POPJA